MTLSVERWYYQIANDNWSESRFVLYKSDKWDDETRQDIENKVSQLVARNMDDYPTGTVFSITDRLPTEFITKSVKVLSAERV